MGWVTLAADGDDVVRSARTHDGTGGTNGTDVATIPCAASSTSPLASTAEDSHGSRHHAKRRTLRAGADRAGGTRAGAGLRKSRSAQRDPGPGAGAGRGRLAQCEPSATRSTPPRAVRAQRDGIRLSSIRASPPRTMRPEVTSPIRLPRGRGADGQRGPRRGRVRICCKGAPRRDRPRRKARNINDSLRASRRDPGLCNRFGQTAPRGPRERRRGPGGDHGGRRPGLRTGAPG